MDQTEEYNENNATRYLWPQDCRLVRDYYSGNETYVSRNVIINENNKEYQSATKKATRQQTWKNCA